MEDVKSPCIKVCQHDSNGICYGCRRTREEVGDWGLYTNEQKQAVLDQLSLRKNSDDGPTGFMRQSMFALLLDNSFLINYFNCFVAKYEKKTSQMKKAVHF